MIYSIFYNFIKVKLEKIAINCISTYMYQLLLQIIEKSMVLTFLVKTPL